MLRACRLVIDTGIHFKDWDFKKSYQYLIESIRTFPRPKEFVEMLKQNNFNRTSVRQLSGNIVCIYKCRKS